MLDLQQDKERLAFKGLKIDKKTSLIKREIERLALIMESAGRNYITDEEFQNLVPDYEDHRELIEHTFLFNKADKAKWQFDH